MGSVKKEKSGPTNRGARNGMSAKTDVNRRVLAIQAKKKRHKPSKRKGKANIQDESETSGAQCSKASTTQQGQGSSFYQDASAQRPYSSDNGNRYSNIIVILFYCIDILLVDSFSFTNYINFFNIIHVRIENLIEFLLYCKMISFVMEYFSEK